MATLRIQAPDGKFLRVDVGSTDPSQYDSIATLALQDYMKAKTPQGTLPSDVVNEEGVQADPFNVIGGPAKALGTEVQAGGAGIGNLVAGNGLNTAAADVNAVESGQTPSTMAGKVGSALGSLVTPAQIAAQGGIGAFLEASGFGPWVVDTLKGWAGDAAVVAVGKIQQLAKSLGVTNFDALGEFLLKPVMVGEKEFPAIITATSSPQDMLDAAEAIQQAAGKQLGVVSKVVDSAINDSASTAANTPAVNEAPVAIDLASLQQKLAALKEEAVGDIPNLGAKVAGQFDAAIEDLDQFIKNQLAGPTDTTFSDLSAIKTKIGNLVYKHGSPLESKAALQDVYQAISQTLDDASSKLGGSAGVAYDQANEIYHQVSAIISGLEGKVIDARKWFDVASLGAGITAAAMSHGPSAIAAVPAAMAATKMVTNYAPQAIASGLNTAAPLISSGLQAGIRSVPVIGQAIASGLGIGQ